jgi:hypothetical protein
MEASGLVLYQETHAVVTNAFGQADLKVGKGSVVSGDFDLINWGDSSKFPEVELDTNGGTDYVSMGTTRLFAVPYAFFTDKSGTARLVSEHLLT